MKALWAPLAFPGLVLVTWYIVAASGLISGILLPSPGSVGHSLLQLTESGDMAALLGGTLRRFGLGYAIAIMVGIPLGVLVGRSALFRAFAEPSLDFLRSLPVTALFPFFLLVLGIHDQTIVGMVAAACVFVIALGTATGVRQSSEGRIRMLRILGGGQGDILRYVLLPEALPHITIALRTTASLALIVAIVSEMLIGGSVGLGQRLYDAYTISDSSQLYALLLVAGSVGYIMNAALRRGESRFVHWAGK